MLHKSTLNQRLNTLIEQHLKCYTEQECNDILVGLNVIYKTSIGNENNPQCVDINEFQSVLSKINEKELRRRDEGVYYTPKDITEYIVANSYLNFLNNNIEQVYQVPICIDKIKELNVDKLIKAKIFDPTCGTAEFLLSAVELKLEIIDRIDDDILLTIISSIYGNDIAVESVLLSKIRLFFAIVQLLKDKKKSLRLAKILKENFYTKDFVLLHDFTKTFDIIIGNPPYVEYRKLVQKPETKFGNTYADVLHNSINCLRSSGTIGFIIPLSFVSTTRMKPIRDVTYSNLEKMFVLNFADRPDCLFDGVHQKLTIVIGVKAKNNCKVYSSSYHYWYSKERKDLLNNMKVFPIVPIDKYIPKIGSQLEQNIFNKIIQVEGKNLYEIDSSVEGGVPLYLNMRGCFWMKVFSFNPGSNEYKAFYCTSSMQPYLISIFNSSLFFFYWTIVSDCWHITSKELDEFIIPNIFEYQIFDKLWNTLEEKLESTKKFIGSKQTDYEYKHKECKDVIDKIDDALQPIYGLTDEELDYIKKYKLTYRMSNG